MKVEMESQRSIETIGNGSIICLAKEDSLNRQDLIWSVMVGESVELRKGERIIIYRNAVGHLSLSIKEETYEEDND